MDKQALDRYLTTEPDNGYQNWLEKVWDNIPESEISYDDYEKYERFFDDLAEKLSCAGRYGFPTVDFSKDVFMNRFRNIKRKTANIKNNLVLPSSMTRLLTELNKLGHTTLLIGGCVRDAYLGIKPKDIDIEVYGINYEKLEQFLSAYGRVDIVGKTFGVIVFTHYESSMRYDFSIPRKENKLGVGHTGFDITLDANLSVKEAAERRDFTFNALAYDPMTDELHDYYGGIGDLENKIIRHTSDKFEDDFLRIIRAMQFQCRFDFDIHYTTLYKIQKMLSYKDSHIETNEFNLLSKERVFEEWMKWAEKGINHSRIFKFMRDTHLINYYPELKALKETPQDEIWHPEGDVEIHTTLCLKKIDRIVKENNITGREKAILVLAVLFHDIAKPPTTERKEKRGRMCITSEGHEEMGGVMTKDILSRMGFHAEIIEPICALITNHLAGVHLSSIAVSKGKVKFVKKLSRKLHPATIQQLLYVMDADTNGRGGTEHKEPSGAKEMAEIANQVHVTTKQYEYILMGRHLIEAGMKPSPEFGLILKASYEAQENGEFNNIDDAKLWLKEWLIKRDKLIALGKSIYDTVIEETTPSEEYIRKINNSKRNKGVIALIIAMGIIALLGWLLSMACEWQFGKENQNTSFVVVFVIVMMIGMPLFDHVQNKYLKK